MADMLAALIRRLLQIEPLSDKSNRHFLNKRAKEPIHMLFIFNHYFSFPNQNLFPQDKHY